MGEETGAERMTAKERTDAIAEMRVRIERAIAEAVAAEKERCAKVVEGRDWRDSTGLLIPNQHATRRVIAEAIRAGEKEGAKHGKGKK